MIATFNFWSVLVILFPLAAILLGWKSATGKREECFLKIKLEDGILGFVASVALAPLFILESLEGAISALGATADMARENPDYAISAVIGLCLAAVLFGMQLAFVSAVVRLLRSRYLSRRKRLHIPVKKRRLTAPSFIIALRQKVQAIRAKQKAKKEKRYTLDSDLLRVALKSHHMEPGMIEIIDIPLYSEGEIKRMKWRRRKKA